MFDLIMEAVLEVERIEREMTPYELERGKPVPDTNHSLVQSNLIFELRLRYNKQYRFLSELALDTRPTGSTPDLAIYPMFEADFQTPPPARRSDPPLCCIEIQSPSQSPEEMLSKAQAYFAFGVKSCWIVQPAMQGVFVYDRPGHYEFFHGDDTLRDPNLGLEVSLAAVFA